MRSASGVPGISTAGTDFSHTVTWGGVVGIYDSNGQLLSDYSLTSASGSDWTKPFTAPVPEPEAYAMMLAGLGLLRLLARRKMSA
ncbi:MAG: PEP-CTERM sorting domain-containing protein [Rhodocyclaceae bacterium]|nr:PEP-CTERM sorting domain-containing protein [Rhodocyclaceae bacterium]